MGVLYTVYGSDSAGQPIDYSSPIAALQGTTFTTQGLSPGTWKFGVRAKDTNGEEQNIDAAVTIVIDANGNDITNVPLPPTGLRAFATANAGIRVEWWYPLTTGAKTPSGFHVYLGTGGSPSYTSPVATASYSSGIFNSYQANLSGLTGGTTYTVGVRAYNATGEESNTSTVSCLADASGPTAVTSLTAVAVV